MTKILPFIFLLFAFSSTTQSQILDSYTYPTKLSMPANYYGISYHSYIPFMPLSMTSLSTPSNVLVWYGVKNPVRGIRITEYGDFALNKIYPMILEMLTYTPSEYVYEWDERDDKWVFSHYNSSQPGLQLTPSPAGSYIEYYSSPEFRRFYLAAMYRNEDYGAIGMGFGSSRIKNITTNGMKVTGDFQQQLLKYSKYSLLVNGGGSTTFLDLILQWNLDLKYIGNIQFTHTIPSMSIFTPTKNMKLNMLPFSVFPYLNIGVRRSIGPLRFGLDYNVPAKFIVIPWYFSATELNLSCGLAI